MRRRRAIIYDDEPVVLEMLAMFLSRRGYEVHSFPEPVLCPIFMNNDRHCHNDKPCADVVITDFKMPGMSGVELLQRQIAKGCRLDIRNKAIISGFVDEDAVTNLGDLGCAFFRKPFPLRELGEWLDGCEQRMPVSVAVGVPRKERREAVQIKVTYTLPSQPDKFNGIVTNFSDSGFCLRMDRGLTDEKIVLVNEDLPVSCREASARWTMKMPDASFIAGFACC